jgi:hypothetical protein
MIFARMVYPIKSSLKMSFYMDPRAQRVCSIYGVEAGYEFALKAIMRENSWYIVIYGMLITLLSMSY